MKILWIINISPPIIDKFYSKNHSNLAGWLFYSSNLLSNFNGLDLHIAFPYEEKISSMKIEKITYHSFNLGKYKFNFANNKFLCEKLVNSINPDLIHIHGTEFSHSLIFGEVCAKLSIPFVVSIQGLLSVYANHLFAALPIHVIKGNTLRNLIFNDSIYSLRKKFLQKSKNEVRLLKLTKNVIGRTSWDYANSKIINPKINYFKCNEILRNDFYESSKWNIKNCNRHQIFLTQGHYSIKGLHIILRTLSLLKTDFPNVKLHIAGNNITSLKFKDKIKRTFYSKYILTLINKYNLKDNVVFLGNLNSKQMIYQYLTSHVYIIPSSIENSPNSLGEAMLLGLPIVASFVGGIPDFLTHNQEGFLYPFESHELAYFHIKNIFENDELAIKISLNSVNRANRIHSAELNSFNTLEIYNKVIKNV